MTRDLFDFAPDPIKAPPISRKQDPETSKLAEQRQNEGPRLTRAIEVLVLVKRHPGHTCGELGRLMHQKYPDRPIVATAKTPGQRMSDLAAKKLVEHREKRACTDSGDSAYPWYITTLGENKLLEIFDDLPW